MANLQINLDIDSEQFNKLCVDNIEDLPKDKLEEILLKAVEVALIKDKENPEVNANNNILITKQVASVDYGYTRYKYEPTPLLKEIIDRIDLTPFVEPMANSIKEYIENNYQEIIKTYVIEKFANLLFSNENRWALKNEIIGNINSSLK